MTWGTASVSLAGTTQAAGWPAGEDNLRARMVNQRRWKGVSGRVPQAVDRWPRAPVVLRRHRSPLLVAVVRARLGSPTPPRRHTPRRELIGLGGARPRGAAGRGPRRPKPAPPRGGRTGRRRPPPTPPETR